MIDTVPEFEIRNYMTKIPAAENIVLNGMQFGRIVPYQEKLRRGKFSSGKIFVGEKYSSLDQNFIRAPLKSSFEIFRRGKLFVT